MTDTIVKPSTATMIERLRAEITNGLKLAFDYTPATGETKAVEGFIPEILTERNGDVLLTGKNNADQWRSYYIGRMANASIVSRG